MTTTKRSNFAAALRTTILLASLTGLLVVIGALIGGPQMALVFLGIGLVLNLGAYWFSDRLALAMSRAKPIEESEAPRLYQIVRELTTRADLPMPRLYMIPQDQLRGVLAHELAHVRHRDILITSVASAIGGAITYLGYMLLFFGGDDDESPLGLVASLALVILAPIAATIIQLAISRQREFSADATGAEITGNPESLASALERLEEGAKAIPMRVNQSAEPLYIVKPFSGKGLASLFSTHPPIEERVRRLRQMRPALV